MNPTIRIHQASRHGLPIIVGCPVRDDTQRDMHAARITWADGDRVDAQARWLGPVRLDGTRWVELAFMATRTGDAQVELIASPPDGRTLATASGRSVTLDTGCMKLTCSASADEPAVRLSSERGQGQIPPALLLHDTDADESTDRDIRIVRNGPALATVQLTGRLGDQRRGMSYRLTVSVWAGASTARLDWMLIHDTTGHRTLRVDHASLSGTFDLGGDSARAFVQSAYGQAYTPRYVVNPEPVSIITDGSCWPTHVADPAMLLDDNEYPDYLTPPLVGVAPWLELRGRRGSVLASVVDFEAARPNALASEADRLDFHMIPTGHSVDWPQGRRREQSLLLAFDEVIAQRAAAGPSALLQSVDVRGRAQPTRETLGRWGCFDLDRTVDTRHLRLNLVMQHLCALDTPADKWNLGDTIDEHYTRSYVGTPNSLEWRAGATPRPVTFHAGGGRVLPESLVHDLEPVWTNNEYDIIHALAVELMRTGEAAHLRMLRWVARHTIEVDFVCFSDDPVFHGGIPFHSRRHNMKGVINSHLWTQGLLEYHALTGDDDALATALALGEKIIRINAQMRGRGPWKFDRELGWALLSLVCLVEAGHDRFLPECRAIIQFLRDYDRDAHTGAVNLSRGRAGRSLARQMIDNGFGYASMIEAVDRYVRATGCDATARWLEALLGDLLDAFHQAVADREPPRLLDMVTLMFAIGYERTGDRRFIDAGLLILDLFFDPVTRTPFAWGQVKPAAMAHRALGRFLHHAQALDLLDRFEYPAAVSARAVREDAASRTAR